MIHKIVYPNGMNADGSNHRIRKCNQAISRVLSYKQSCGIELYHLKQIFCSLEERLLVYISVYIHLYYYMTSPLHIEPILDISSEQLCSNWLLTRVR